MPLTHAQRLRLANEIAGASRLAMHRAVVPLATYWRSGAWLSPRNRYKNDSARRVTQDATPGGGLVHQQLAEYIAASAIVHCFDGWSYLGRALEAEMIGDPDTARHLGYYSELRAAMSLLASDGIGVFNRHHVVVAPGPRCKVLTTFGGTHEFVWEALEIWARSQSGANAVLTSITPSVVPLSHWLSQFSIGATFLGTLLHQWGLDLKRLADDRESRNTASYRPTAFTSPAPRSITDTMNTVLQFWEVCDPESLGGFPVLDRHLLRRSLALGWKGSPGGYAHQLQIAIASVAPTAPSSSWWHNFLSFSNLAHPHQLIADANGTKTAAHPDHSKQVIARATLLLRVATGTASDLLRSAGTTASDDLEFWLSSRSVSRRLWPEADPRTLSVDLWDDVADASISVEAWLNSSPTSSARCYHGLWAERAREAATLATTERAFLWGAGL